jgi:hypothetical protein
MEKRKLTSSRLSSPMFDESSYLKGGKYRTIQPKQSLEFLVAPKYMVKVDAKEMFNS